MKNMRLVLSAFAVVAIVSSALALKANSAYNAGTVFCGSTCAVADRIDFKQDDAGTHTKVCGTTGQPPVEITEYQLVNGVCTAIAAGKNYSTTGH